MFDEDQSAAFSTMLSGTSYCELSPSWDKGTRAETQYRCLGMFRHRRIVSAMYIALTKPQMNCIIIYGLSVKPIRASGMCDEPHGANKSQTIWILNSPRQPQTGDLDNHDLFSSRNTLVE
jgi:hypothetical protein